MPPTKRKCSECDFATQVAKKQAACIPLARGVTVYGTWSCASCMHALNEIQRINTLFATQKWPVIPYQYYQAESCSHSMWSAPPSIYIDGKYAWPGELQAYLQTKIANFELYT